MNCELKLHTFPLLIMLSLVCFRVRECERDGTGKKVKWDDNFKNENEFNFGIDSQKGTFI